MSSSSRGSRYRGAGSDFEWIPHNCRMRHLLRIATWCSWVTGGLLLLRRVAVSRSAIRHTNWGITGRRGIVALRRIWLLLGWVACSSVCRGRSMSVERVGVSMHRRSDLVKRVEAWQLHYGCRSRSRLHRLNRRRQ